MNTRNDDRSRDDEWVHGEMNGQCTGPAVSAPEESGSLPDKSLLVNPWWCFHWLGPALLAQGQQVCLKFQTWSMVVFFLQDTGSSNVGQKADKHGACQVVSNTLGVFPFLSRHGVW